MIAECSPRKRGLAPKRSAGACPRFRPTQRTSRPRRARPAPLRPTLLLALCAHIGLAVWRVEAAGPKPIPLAVTTAKDGCGFIDTAAFRGRRVLSASKGFVGAAVVLTEAGDGTAASLFAHSAPLTLQPVIAESRSESGTMTFVGAYTDGKARVPGVRRIRIAGATLDVTEEADFTALPKRYVVARHELNLPLVPDGDPHVRMFGFGGAHRAELFRMDMNDINRGGKQLISAPRGHWPYWDVAGVLQLPGSYRIWRANHADTMAYPIEDGSGAPGWADYSEPEWGVTAAVDEPAKAAPWSIRIDARKGVLTVAPRPPSQPPIAGKQFGKRTFRFHLIFHEKSWPATVRCELPFGRYRELLEALAVSSGGRKQPYVLHSPIGTSDPETIIFRERLQPSVVLRTFYRGDAWRMQGRMKAIGVAVPRNQPIADWDKAAKQYLDHVRTHGMPKRNE